MSDNIDAVEHQKHATAIAELRSDTNGLKEGLTEVKGGLRDLSSDMKTILSAVQSNSRNGSSDLMKFIGAFGAFLFGFMTLIIMPMQERTDKRRLEQDDKNKLQHANAISNARDFGELKGRVGCLERLAVAIDSSGPRGANK